MAGTVYGVQQSKRRSSFWLPRLGRRGVAGAGLLVWSPIHGDRVRWRREL